jgi:hypothetical protein
MKNKFTRLDTYAILYIDSKKHGKHECLIDLDILEKLIKLGVSWSVKKQPANKTLYVCASMMWLGRYTTVYLHRFVMAITHIKWSYEVDHKNHNGLDNRRENLVVTTTSENQLNRAGLNSNNKSGVANVHFCNSKHKWMVKVWVKNKKLHLGCFVSKQKAKEAIDKFWQDRRDNGAESVDIANLREDRN